MATKGHKTGSIWPRARALSFGWATIIAGGVYSLALPLFMIGGVS